LASDIVDAEFFAFSGSGAVWNDKIRRRFDGREDKHFPIAG
jgi:hypothetical protein